MILMIGLSFFYLYCILLCILKGLFKRALGLACVPVFLYIFFGPK